MPDAKSLYGHPWGEPEFIVVLDAYFCHRDEPRDEDTPYVRKLAGLLGRTPASIVMRLENYAAIDPSIQGKQGLRRGGPRCRRVFLQWAEDQDGLRKTAAVLIRDAESSNIPTLFEPTPVRVPKAFGRYELDEKLGEGGFGWVFSCINTETRQLFAIKILKPEYLRDDETFGRFRREIRILKTVRHAKVIQIYDDNLDTESEYPAFIMDLAQGSLIDTLEEFRGAGGLFRDSRPFMPAHMAKAVVLDIMDAAHALHSGQARLVHRDINPNNILRGWDEKWILGDFGLAKFLSAPPASATYRTEHSKPARWGTIPYAAPEQWRNFADVDERADIYALGVLIWDLFSSEYPPIQREHTGLSPGLSEVFLKATERERTRRFGSVTEMREAFLTAAIDFEGQ